MKIQFKIDLTKSQQEMLDLLEDHKYLVALMSRQQGKSTFLKLMATKWLLEPNNSILYICPTLKLARKFLKDITKVVPKQLLVTNNATDLILESITGSQLYFYSAEQGDNLRGFTCTHLLGDELAFWRNSRDFYWEVVFATFKVRGQKALFVSTPRGKNNLFYDFCEKAKAGTRNWAFIKKTIYDDSLCNNIEEIREYTPEIAWRQEFLCEFLDNTGAFFTKYIGCYKPEINFNYKEKLWCGVDLSSVGKDETVFTLINQSNQVKQFIIKGSLDEKYKQIADLFNTYNCIGYIEQNSIGEPIINEITKLVKNKSLINKWLTTNKSKSEIITQLAVALENNKLSHSESELNDQLGSFEFKISESGNMKFSGKKDDRILSLAIALEAKNKLRPYSASNFTFI